MKQEISVVMSVKWNRIAQVFANQVLVFFKGRSEIKTRNQQVTLTKVYQAS